MSESPDSRQALREVLSLTPADMNPQPKGGDEPCQPTAQYVGNSISPDHAHQVGCSAAFDVPSVETAAWHPADMGEWVRKEEVEKTESSIADIHDQNEWSVVVALIDELSTLRAKLGEKDAAIKLAHKEWADTDTEVKRLAETVGVQGEGKATPFNDQFRTVEMVVEDLVKKLVEVEKERDALRDTHSGSDVS